MTEQEMRTQCACFTGHRPEKLKQPEAKIIAGLEEEIRRAIDDGITTFISGMARGVDIWAAEIVLRLRNEGLPIKLIAASPFEGFERSWSADWLNRYKAVISEADLVIYICQGYSRACFQERNEWMVDHSSRVIAVFNGEKGGTKNTIDYARTKAEIKITQTSDRLVSV